MPYEHKSTHVADGLGRIITPLKGKPIFEAILSAWLAEIQEIETSALLDQFLQGGIPVALTDLEDRLGEIVGQPREGRSNAEYALWIQARILVNRGSGAPEEMLKIAKLTSGAADGTIVLTEEYPAAFWIELGELLSFGGYEIARMIQSARPAGVRFHMTWYETEDSFTFSDTDLVYADADKGFGDTVEDVGGEFSHAAGDPYNA